MNSDYEFNTGERLEQLMDIERLTIKLKRILTDIKFNDERKNKFRDLLTSFKEGKVQKDLSLSYNFNDNTFITLNRKDCLGNVEKEVANSTKEIAKLKEELEVVKISLIGKLLACGIDLNELDDEIIVNIQKEYMKKLVKNKNK